jgi:hypothetical protein
LERKASGALNEHEDVIKRVTGVAYASTHLALRNKLLLTQRGCIAGADTVSVSMITFDSVKSIISQTTAVIEIAILAMTLFPEARRNAQAEIDQVVGSHRLPDYGDRNSLPYFEAFYREVNRWHPANPLGNGSNHIMESGVLH